MLKFAAQTTLSVLMAVGLAGTASAKSPKDVDEAYTSYKTALTDKNFEQAEQSALKAWKAAEESLGDTKTTGDLAQNYADIAAFNDTSYSKIRKAYKRSIKLSTYYPEGEAFSVRMDRTVSLATVLRSNENIRTMDSTLEDITVDAEAANVPATTLLAEIYTLRADVMASRRQWGGAQKLGQRAVDLFEQAEDNVLSPYREVAAQYAALGVGGKLGQNRANSHHGQTHVQTQTNCCTTYGKVE